MATTGGSLMGKADTTLVSAAFREGSTNVQKDLSDVYTKREKAFKTFQEGISTIFENLGEEDRNEQKELKEGLEDLSDNTQTWDALAEVDSQVMIDFKDELKAATTDLEKRKLWSKFKNYSELSKNHKEGMENVIDLGVTNNLLTKPGSNERKLLIKIVNDWNNNTDETKPSYDPKKGDIVYTDPDTNTKMSFSELQRKIGRKDSTVNTDINALINKAAKNENNQPYEDSEDGTIPGFRDDLYNDILARLNSSDDIANAGSKAANGMKYSVEHMLMGKAGKDNPLTIELFDILKTLDVDKDGTSGTTEDASYVTSTNAVELAKEIMNNDDLYKEVIATAITNMSGKKAYDISQIKKETETPQWKIPGTAEWERVRKANLELNTPTKTPFSADSYYGPRGSTVKGRQINNYWNMLNSGKITLGDPGVEYNRNTETGAWVNSQDQTEISGNQMLENIQNALNVDAGSKDEAPKQTYNILNDQNFKQFSGAAASGTYTMPKDQELTVAKLWNNAASGASGSSEKFAVSTLNTTFGGGFTQEDAGNKWIVGYNRMTFNLETPGDKDKLLAEIKKQKLIDQKF